MTWFWIGFHLSAKQYVIEDAKFLYICAMDVSL